MPKAGERAKRNSNQVNAVDSRPVRQAVGGGGRWSGRAVAVAETEAEAKNFCTTTGQQ